MRIAIASYYDEIEGPETEEKKCINIEKSWLHDVLSITKTICVFPVGANTTSNNSVVVIDADSIEEVAKKIERIVKHSPLELYFIPLRGIAKYISGREIEDEEEAMSVITELFKRLGIRVKKWRAINKMWLKLNDVIPIALSMDEDDKIIHVKNGKHTIILFDSEHDAIRAKKY